MGYYPVHVEGHLDPHLSRWRWLVKWVLAIPHWIVLAFLWLAFVVLSVVALFAILVSGRYPRAIFDFNVGVMRWSWRVSFYAYGALGTDRYPPFTLADRPDYPARLRVDYPARLSRGLVLVKWWLLALPHYLVLGVLVGGAGWAVSGVDDRAGGLGLIGVLVLVAAVVLLFSGRYPNGVFDLVLGLQRWVLRVAAYAALMTDAYPPFRLDQGGDDPDAAPPSGGQPSTPAPAPPPPPPSPAPGWSAGRIVGVVVGSLLVVAALGAGGTAGALAVADRFARNDDGYLMSSTHRIDADAHAVRSESIELHTDAPADFLPEHLLGDVRVTADGGDVPVFVGIASSDDVDAYLAGVRTATLTRFDDGPVLDVTAGGAPTTLPTGTDIWVAQASGAGRQTLTWEPADGDWTVVVMPADGRSPVEADVAAGATVPALDWLVPSLLGLTLVLLALGALVTGLSIPRSGGRAPAPPGARPAPPRTPVP